MAVKDFYKMRNSEIKIVFQPYDKEAHGGRRRFGVGSSSLSKYIGEKNASNVMTKGVDSACNNRNLKARIKFRAHGIVDIYLK